MTPYDIWAEIDLSAISSNVENLKRLLPEKTRLMAVVKADAYGHGAVETAREAVASGADALGVARIGEAIELRHGGIKAPILILGQCSPVSAEKIISYDLIQTVCSYAAAADFSARAKALGGRIRVHVKIDTGMGRLGIVCNDMTCFTGENGFESPLDEILSIYELPGLVVEGIYTHFATADSADKTTSRLQFTRFTEVLERLEEAGVDIPCRHAANSAAIIDMPETHLDMVRAGISIYGHYPSVEVDMKRVFLSPAMTIRARIVHVKTVGPGFKISYGWTAETTGRTIIATVAAGYADGVSRLLSSAGSVTVNGREARVIGRVCMDYAMIDITNIPEVSAGDSATIFGDSGTGAIPVEAVAEIMGTINYEVLAMVSGRVPRIHFRR